MSKSNVTCQLCRDDLPRRVQLAVERAIARGEIPGAVVDIAHRGRTLLRRAWGRRCVVGQPERMTQATIFDLASVTKVVATATAAAALVDDGRLALHAPASEWLPGLRRGRKRGITIEHLLTHTSGLPPYRNYLAAGLSSREAVFDAICAEKLLHLPGERFAYSDLGAILLGRIIELVSGRRLDEFCAERIFRPLGMSRTAFNPPASWRNQCAPTSKRRGSKLLRGEVHDENAFALGGVAGHAGLFSTAADLRRFADMVLNEGWSPRGQVLSPPTVREFLRPRALPDGRVRALGWDVDTPYSGARGHVFPIGSVGHTGFTGPSIWLDPASQTSVIILTNRVHPEDKGDARPLRVEVANLAAAAVQTWRPQPEPVRTGLDALAEDDFRPLRGAVIGLVANHTAIDRRGRHLLDLLLERDDLSVAAIFSPEHGFEGRLDEFVPSGRHERSDLPIYSLYGEHRAPTPDMLRGLDTLVFDIQDIGARFYTYAATMRLCLRAASDADLRFVVLDRPNPINGVDLAGPVPPRPRPESLVSAFAAPTRHGLTMGELARLAALDLPRPPRLHVVRLKGWRRAMFFDETGLPWVNPSPNMRNLKQAILYPAVGAVEFANVSVGRGTDTPFEVLGAPWVDAVEFARALNDYGLPGVSFTPIWFTPSSNKYEGERCAGVYIMLDDRLRFRPARVSLAFIQTLHKLYGRRFRTGRTPLLLGDARAAADARRGVSIERIAQRWEPAQQAFRDRVHRIRIYP